MPRNAGPNFPQPRRLPLMEHCSAFISLPVSCRAITSLKAPHQVICGVTACRCFQNSQCVCVHTNISLFSFFFCLFFLLNASALSVSLVLSLSLSHRPCPGSYSVFKCMGNNWPSLSSQDYENKSPFGGEQRQQSLKSCYMGYYPATNCFFFLKLSSSPIRVNTL